jgi:hypothetical protein
VGDLVADDPLISRLTECMLRARAALWQEYLRLHQVVVAMVARDERCARFMRIPGVGPISALAFKTTVDDPSRFRSSRTVGAYLGLTSRRSQSGTSIDIQGHISKAGGQGREARSLRGRQADADPFQGMVGAQGLRVEIHAGLRLAAEPQRNRRCSAPELHLSAHRSDRFLRGKIAFACPRKRCSAYRPHRFRREKPAPDRWKNRLRPCLESCD